MADRRGRGGAAHPPEGAGTRDWGGSRRCPAAHAGTKDGSHGWGPVQVDAYSAYVLAYDAARFACVALLAQQGMRATTNGGHYAVERAVRAQFGAGFRPFADLRRRRNELEYPRLPADTATAEEAQHAAEVAERLISAADALLDRLAFFAQPGNAEP